MFLSIVDQCVIVPKHIFYQTMFCLVVITSTYRICLCFHFLKICLDLLLHFFDAGHLFSGECSTILGLRHVGFFASDAKNLRLVTFGTGTFLLSLRTGCSTNTREQLLPLHRAFVDVFHLLLLRNRHSGARTNGSSWRTIGRLSCCASCCLGCCNFVLGQWPPSLHVALKFHIH